MKIIKHKSIHMNGREIIEIAQGKPAPAGLAVDVGCDHIVIQPEDKINLFGEYGPGTEYELVGYIYCKVGC